MGYHYCVFLMSLMPPGKLRVFATIGPSTVAFLCELCLTDKGLRYRAGLVGTTRNPSWFPTHTVARRMFTSGSSDPT